MTTLHAIFQVELHVVAQVVESELVVSAVGDVSCISIPALLVIEIVHDHADGEPEEAIKLPHPFRVAFGQVVVNRDHVHAATAQRVQVNRKRRNQRFSFAGLHF